MCITKDKQFYRTLLALAVPMVLQNLVTFSVGLADQVMIGRLGDAAVSGVYLGTQIQTVLQVLSAGIEGSILLLAAQYWGRRDVGSIRRVVSIGMGFSLLLGLLFTVVCAAFPRQASHGSRGSSPRGSSTFLLCAGRISSSASRRH